MAAQGRLFIICGSPGSGKTSTAIALAARYQAVRFAPDDWMDALAINLWDGEKRAAIEQLQWQLAQDILRLGGTAIIEWGTWGRAERDQLRQSARALGARVHLIHMDAPIDTLLERVKRRNRESPPIDRATLEAGAAAFDVPTPDELSLYDPPETA